MAPISGLLGSVVTERRVVIDWFTMNAVPVVHSEAWTSTVWLPAETGVAPVACADPSREV